MTRIAAATVAALVLVWADVFADDLAGQASIVDGDTLEIHGTRIRLWGIDAPESSQLCRGEDSLQYRCGAKAANDLDAFVARRPVSCIPISHDRYGRTVASCSVAGADLAEWLVGNGAGAGLTAVFKGKIRHDPTRSRARRARHVGGQLRRAVAVSGVHPSGRKPGQLLRRRERASIAPDDRAECQRDDRALGIAESWHDLSGGAL
jgi:endonuclease YncB( thermonuclease family)